MSFPIGRLKKKPRTIDGVLLPHQQALLADTTSRIVGIVGGLGSAKTAAGAVKIVDLAIRNAGIPVLVIGATYGELRDYILPALVDESPDALGFPIGALPRRHIKHVHNKNENNLYFDIDGCTCEIRLRSGDSPKSVKGSNVAAVWIDEPGLIDDDVIRKALARMRAPTASCRQLVLTGTPEGMRGLFYEWMEASPVIVDGECVSRAIRARTDDNPFLPADYIAVNLVGFSDDEQEAYRNGRFVPPRGRVYTHFDDERHVVPHVGDLDGDLVMCCDFNVSPMVWLMGFVDAGDRLHVVDELVRRNTDTIAQCREAMRWWSEHAGADAVRDVVVYVDASGAARATAAPMTDVQHLRSAGFRVIAPARNPLVRDRVFSVQLRLQLGAIVIDPRCALLVRSLRTQPHDDDGTPKKVDDLDHAPDALGYLVHQRWPAMRPAGNTKRTGTYA